MLIKKSSRMVFKQLVDAVFEGLYILKKAILNLGFFARSRVIGM